MTTPADDREAFQADIDLLRSILRGYPTSIASRDALAAVARLQSALSTERARILEPQPVAWYRFVDAPYDGGKSTHVEYTPHKPTGIRAQEWMPLYIAPPPLSGS